MLIIQEPIWQHLCLDQALAESGKKKNISYHLRQDLFKVGAHETVQHKLLRAFNRHL